MSQDDNRPALQKVTPSEDRFLASDVFSGSDLSLPPPRRGGEIMEKARKVDIYHKCDVIVVGGGPAGCAAVWAAAKAGAASSTATQATGEI